jgi:hypothetical protein
MGRARHSERIARVTAIELANTKTGSIVKKKKWSNTNKLP